MIDDDQPPHGPVFVVVQQCHDDLTISNTVIVVGH